MTDEQAFDEQVIAKILCGSHRTPAVRLRPGEWGVSYLSETDIQRVGPVCAVGAGILYVGLDGRRSPAGHFADEFGVSMLYVRGVSDGFDSEYCPLPSEPDYLRGYAVGAAVRDSMGDE